MSMDLTPQERAELTRQARKRQAGELTATARRSKVILMVADGYTWKEIVDALSCSRGFVNLWRHRFAADRIAGLFVDGRIDPGTQEFATEKRILAASAEAPPDGLTRWSTRSLGERLGINHMRVQRVWRKHGLSPQRELPKAGRAPLPATRGARVAPPGRDRNAVRERILREAATLIRLRGTQAVAVDDVIANIGVSQANFDAHFKGSDQMVGHAIGYMFDQRYVTLISFAQLNATEPNNALRGFVSEYLSPDHRDAPETGCPIPLVGPEVPRLHAVARQQFGFGVDRMIEGMTNLLTRMDVNRPKVRARALLAEIVGALTLARAIPDREESDHYLHASTAAILARLESTATMNASH